MAQIGFDYVVDEGCESGISFSGADVVPGIPGTWLITLYTTFTRASGSGYVDVRIDGHRVGYFWMDATHENHGSSWTKIVQVTSSSDTVPITYTLTGTLVANPILVGGTPTVDARIEGVLICPT